MTYGTAAVFTATENASGIASTDTLKFYDGTTFLGLGVIQNMGAGIATWQYTTTPTQLMAASNAQEIQGVYNPTDSVSEVVGTLQSGETVSRAPLTIAAATNTKTYDGTTTATALPTVTGLIGSDTVTGLAEVYGEANVGSSKTLSVSAYTINDGNSGNDYTVTTVNSTTGAILPGPFSKDVLTLLGGDTLVAGNPFLVTVQASDPFGNPVASYSGPSTIPIAVGDPSATIPSNVSLTNGFGYFLATLKTAGTYTITATDETDSISGASSTITVTPAPAVYFKVAAPATAVTNTSFPIAVTALDAFNNVVPSYTGTVHLSSTDSAAAAAGDLGGNYTFTTGAGQDNGVHVFNVQLLAEGNQKITVADTTATIPAIIGTSSAIAASGLAITALTKTPTGFTATFNQAINPADLTIYGKGSTQQDVLLIGTNSNNGQPYPGTLIVDASKKLITFNVSSNFLAASNPGGSAALPDDTYTVTLLSGVGNNGFQDISGQGLDDGHGGPADYIGTFTTTYQANKTEVLGIADFARGPNASGDTTTLVKVPNDPANGGHVGIPITIYNASNLTSAGFTLTYNANILTVTGGVSDPSNASAMFQMTSNVMSGDGVHSVATFAFMRATPASGTQILGDITAYVPYSARSQYQVKDLLALGNITVNSRAAVVPGNAVDVDAYFGDVNGDHHLDGVDKGLIANVASTLNTGFSAFTLLDPAIIGDVSGDNAVTANSTSLMSNYLLALKVAKIPALPNPPIGDNLFTSPFGADPVLSAPAANHPDHRFAA